MFPNRKRSSKLFPLLAVAIISAQILSACSTSKGNTGNGPTQPETLKPVARDTVVVAIEEDPNSLDTAGGAGTHTGRTVAVAYENLVNTETPDGTVQPWLAKSWEIAPDGLSYTFKLRDNVKFQDGTPLNAEAVKFSFERSMDSKHPYNFGPYPFVDFYMGSVKEIQIIDELTVRFNMKRGDPLFLPNLTWSAFAIISPTAVKQYKEEYPFHGAGTGAFKFVKWDKGSKLTLEANPNYWGGAPKIKNLIFKPVQEEAGRLNQLKNGDVDIIAALNPQLLPEAQKDPKVKVLTSAGIHTWFTMLNTADKPFDNVKVRQAVNYAIDRDAIVNKVLNGAGAPSSNFGYPGTWSYTTDAEIYKYDPAKAKQLLTEAGYPNGFEVNFLVPQSGSGMVAPKELAAVIQAQLQAVGIKVKIDTLEWVTFLNEFQAKGMHLTNKTYHMMELSWMSPAADPGLYANYFLRCDSKPEKPNGYNAGYYCNKEVESLLDQAMATSDQSKRAELYKKAEVLTTQDAPWLYVFNGKNVVAARYDVQGLTPYPNMNVLPLAKLYIGDK